MRKGTGQGSEIHVIGCIVFALTIVVAAAPDGRAGQSIEPLLARWQQLPAIEVRATCTAGAVNVPLAQDPWNRENWRLAPFQLKRQITMRASADDWSAEVECALDSKHPSGSQWLSFVQGEFEYVSRPESAQPLASIQAETQNRTISGEKFLTPFEHQFFTFNDPWSTILRRYDCRVTGEEVVDGYTCWRVENTAKSKELGIVIWVAPEIGFAPVRALLTDYADNPDAPANARGWEMRVLRHEPIDSSWIVAEALLIMKNPRVSDVYHISEFQVTDIKTGSECRPERVRDRLPRETLVRDFIRGEEWDADGRGGRLNVRPLDRKTIDRVRTALRADFERPRVVRSRRWAAMGIIGAALGVMVVLVIARQRWAVSRRTSTNR